MNIVPSVQHILVGSLNLGLSTKLLSCTSASCIGPDMRRLYPIPVTSNTTSEGIDSGMTSCRGQQDFLAFLPEHKARKGGCGRQRLCFSSLDTSLQVRRLHNSAVDWLLLQVQLATLWGSRTQQGRVPSP